MHSQAAPFEIFLVAVPGTETTLCAEALDAGFAGAAVAEGGVVLAGGWPEVWRANLCLRGATRVLARVGAFRAMHLAQLDKRGRKFPWADFLRPDVAVRVEASCRSSRIYHAGAAAQRIETAIREELGAPVTPDAPVRVMVRIEDDMCTISIDTSGEGLHKRGHKLAVGKAPLRETLAAVFLRECGFRGTEPVLDPMCGSGTLVIEAAEIAAGLLPGRGRGFAFEHLATLDGAAWAAMRRPPAEEGPAGQARFHGSDRDDGAVRMAQANAARAGVAASTSFLRAAVSDIVPPPGPPGLVLVNPPYGTRIGERRLLFAVHDALGRALKARFSGWRVGIITSEPQLAKATGLPFLPPGPPVVHGGLKVTLHRTAPLR